MKFKPAPKSRYDQNLVADQPGRLVFFSGFFVALLVGLLVRGLTTPERVQSMVAGAATRIHKDIHVEFRSAELSLSRNGIPRLAVLIKDVEMNSRLKCWGQPLLTADEIVLPISLSSFFSEHQPFKKILAHNVELRLRSVQEHCEENYAPAMNADNPEDRRSGQTVSIVHLRREPEKTVSPTVDGVEIENLKLIYDPKPQSGFEVADFNLSVKSHQPKLILVDAKTHLLKESLFQDYTSHGRVHIEYKEFPEKDLSVQFFGYWREGNYSINADYKFADKTLTCDADLKHIPAAEVIATLKNYNWMGEDLDGRNIWVTLKAQAQGKADELEKTPLTVSDFHVEGDLGEFNVDYFYAQQLKPFKFKPLNAQIKNLDIDRFLEFIKRPRRLPFFGHLGHFNGSLEFAKEGDLKLTGRQEGLELIFANRGRRELQKVTSMRAEMSLKQNRWDLDLKDIFLDQGKLAGGIKVNSDREFKNLDVKIVADNLVFSPQVQSLMSGGGQVAPLKSQVTLKVQDGIVKNLRGSLKIPELTVDNIYFDKVNGQFDMAKDFIQMQWSVADAKVLPAALAHQSLEKVLQVPASEIIPLTQLSGTFEVGAGKDFRWKNNVAVLEGTPVKLHSDGAWDVDGRLNGKVSVRGRGPTNTWMISGHRDEPLLTNSTSGSNELSKKGP